MIVTQFAVYAERLPSGRWSAWAEAGHRENRHVPKTYTDGTVKGDTAIDAMEKLTKKMPELFARAANCEKDFLASAAVSRSRNAENNAAVAP